MSLYWTTRQKPSCTLTFKGTQVYTHSPDAHQKQLQKIALGHDRKNYIGETWRK